MKNLIGFNLFENSRFNYDDLFINKNFKPHLEFALINLAKYNEEKDFVRWSLIKAYLNVIMEMNPPDNLLSSLEPMKKIPYPNGYMSSFDFEEEIRNDSSLGVKSVSWFIKNFLEERIRRLGDSHIVDMEVKNSYISAISDSVKIVINDVLLPANLNNIQKLKYLDYIKKYSTDNYFGSLGVDHIVNKELEENIKRFSNLYKANDSEIGGRILSLLKIFSIHKMEYFINLNMPENMASYVMAYFKDHPESFKTADEIRKSNIYVYNKIKEIIPNMDTSADLGDLGF